MNSEVFVKLLKADGEWTVINKGLTTGVWHQCKTRMYEPHVLTFVANSTCPNCKAGVPEEISVTLRLIKD